MAESRICAASGCDKQGATRQNTYRSKYCSTHENRLRRYGSLDPPIFVDRVASAIIGQRFGRLLGIDEAEAIQGKAQKHRRFVFRCDCGTEKTINPWAVKAGRVVSCGCQLREKASTLAERTCLKHGDCRAGGRAREYGIYRTMLSRCYNPSTERYANHGGRGIVVCDRWRGNGGYEKFLEDMGRKPAGQSLERADNNGPYCPENCRWATAKEQANNTRRNRVIEFEGRSQTLVQWGEEAGIKPNLISLRLKAGWSLADALFRPVRKCTGTNVSCVAVSRRSGTAEYAAWRHMIRRCFNPNDAGYSNYGGRGISVCEEWLEDYETFLRDVGPRPHSRFSLDRIDNDRGYSPDNVRWADRVTQSRNRRAPTRMRRAA
jgi:hypothetical protein